MLAVVAFIAVYTRIYALPGNILTDIPSSVAIDNRTFTSENPMVILEIVPDVSMGTLGYIVGGENNPVSCEDVRSLQDNVTSQEFEEIKKIWNNKVSYLAGGSADADVLTDKIEGFQDRNLFGNAVYGNSCMSDKIKVVVVSPAALTLKEDENGKTNFYDAVTKQSYDPTMIYIHDGRDGADEVYNKMAEYNSRYKLGLKYNAGTQEDFSVSNNLRGDVAYEIYLRAAKEKKTALMVDGTSVNNSPAEGDNISKLMLLTRAVKQDVFVQMFSQEKDENGNDTGHFTGYGLDVTGTVEVGETQWDLYFEGTSEASVGTILQGTCYTWGCTDTKSPETYVSDEKYVHTIEKKKVVWNNAGVFFGTDLVYRYQKGGNYVHVHNDPQDVSNASWEIKINDEERGEQVDSAYPFFQPSMGNLYLAGKILQWNGDQAFENSLLTGKQNAKDYDYSSDGSGLYATDFYKVSDADGNMKNSDVVEYILGGEPDFEVIKKIDVLEIDPAGEAKYSSDNDDTGFQMAQRIAEFFGVYFAEMTKDNYKDYVNVKSIASNGFIGLQGNLYDSYDLIIVSDNNTAAGIKTDNVDVYSSMGESMKLDVTYSGREETAALSGNDFTEKALQKLMAYIDTGKPVLIADSIYNYNSADNDTRVYRLSKAALQAEGKDISNVVCEPADDSNISQKLIYVTKPHFTVDAKFTCTHGTDGIIDTDNAFAADDLDNFVFSGKIEDYKSESADSYYLELALDKDGNGMYTTNQTDDTGYEIVFKGEVRVNNDGSFTTPVIDVPATLRGYIRYKARMSKDRSFKQTSSYENAFVIKYDSKQTVKVLQIQPQDPSGRNDTTFSMDSDAFKNKFKAISDVIGVELDITSVTVTEFQEMYNDITYDSENGDYFDLSKNLLKDYKMVVIGFADDFLNCDIESESALNNLVDYAEQGNAVLFAHDTVTFSAYSDSTVQNGENKKSMDADTYKAAYNISSRFRDIVGMDKYGVSVGSLTTDKEHQGFSNMYLMRWAKLAKDGSSYPMYGGMGDKPVSSIITTDTVTQLNAGQVTEFPYKVEETISVAKTHSQYYQLDLESQNTEEVAEGKKDYSDSYDDVVVWYTLSGNGKGNIIDIADTSLTTNITGWELDGEVYRALAEPVSKDSEGIPVDGGYFTFIPSVDGELTMQFYGGDSNSIKYYFVAADGSVNSSVTAKKKSTAKKTYDVKTGVTYYIYSETGETNIKSFRFRSELEGGGYLEWKDAITDSLNTAGSNGTAVVPSALSRGEATSIYYDLAGQDALNNYYIYSKGNITYSGAGHSDMTGDAELELFVNTVVKALAAGNNPPQVTVQDAVKKTEGMYEQYVRAGEENLTVKFTPYDTDMGIGHGAFASGMIYWDVDKDGIYNQKKDIELNSYGKGELRNLTQSAYTLTADNLAVKYDGMTLDEALKKDSIVIGIVVKDKASSGQSAMASVNMIYRDLFKLE